MPIISITTDFGILDGYVGTMKGVMAGICPEANYADITQLIPPQDVRAAAYVLWTALPYFPADAVHLVVVDPGVGTVRKPIAAKTDWGYLVGPDNGVFSLVWSEAPPSIVVELANPVLQRTGISHTFHGRDIFSPAAAHLAAGVDIREFGDMVEHPKIFESPAMRYNDNIIKGEVLYVDHFGNCITSIGRLNWKGDTLEVAPVFGGQNAPTFTPAECSVTVNGRDIGPIQSTYGKVSIGDPLALIGSEGMLELAINQGHGARKLGISVGDRVTVAF